VTGIDVNRTSLAFAHERYAHERLALIEADALGWVPSGRFDVVVLSNVLEHIEPRVPLLTRLLELVRPNRFLIRVPVLERDWTVGLRRELGLPHFSDPTHVLEYDRETLSRELAQAHLALDEVEQRWGELWAVATPARRH
jgi:SAM-dependent methyltransferase